MMRRPKENIRLLLTGGGTGGHVYPILSIHSILSEAIGVSEVLYVGSRGRAEEQIVPRHGIPLRFVQTAPVAGSAPWKLIPAAWRNFVGTIQAAIALLKFRPDLVVASGGYVSAPICFATFLLKPFLRAPLVINEQNVMPGLMNKVASLFADVMMVSFPESPYFLWNNRCVFTGYPVREDILQERDQQVMRGKLGLDPARTVILIHGGSLGSRSINRAVTALVPVLAGLGTEIQVIHSTGLARGNYDAWGDTLAHLKKACPEGTHFQEADRVFEASIGGGRVRYRLQSYVHEIADCLAASDIVICRGGAGAITEVCAAGKAAIVIPKRGLPGDHQELNALHLGEGQGCEVVFERRGDDGVDYVEAEVLAESVRRLVKSPELRAELGKHARTHFHSHFREKIAETARDVLARKNPEFTSSIIEPAGTKIMRQVDVLVQFLRKQPPGSTYRRLYGIKMEEYLASGDWQKVNNGIKLAGALGRADRLDDLRRWLREGNGFMRRNTLRALDHLGVEIPDLPALLGAALDDSYFEARATALEIAGRHFGGLRADTPFVDKLRAMAKRRFQHFDVRYQQLRVLPLFLPLEEYFAIADRFRFAENTRLRQAILDGLRRALDAGIIAGAHDRDATRRFIDAMPVTTSDFKPQFMIRDSFIQLYQRLSEEERGEDAQ
ncbi:MAG: UDP-N-acetylglucosamine--N-acetylmuramyl-(pentapeptide) pyrophosphoryl-undecaprenol N-acetylglucosamine transferase [Thermoanaerobaculia bacterium]|nr:UDP-N-acetylglucosamine--N-acetylmuramyl-(pentapeptide) pyrophosphoryl-undecaprenol N-acetylglucosamine transferase [Thermoanaerobaculia bacterium]